MIYDDLDTLKEMADFAQVSRYVAEVVSVPHPREGEHGFVKFFLDNLPRWEGALILETGDIQAVTIAKHKEQLSKHYRIVTADWDTLRKFIDKHETYRLAEACGVPCPKSFTMQTMADIDVIL